MTPQVNCRLFFRRFFLQCMLLLLISVVARAQSNNSLAELNKRKADSLLKAAVYLEAARTYVKEYALRSMKPFKMAAAERAGYAYAKVQQYDSSVYWFNAAVKLGGINLVFKENDTDLLELRKKIGYKNLLNGAADNDKKINVSNPKRSIFNFSDIDLFWSVYDQFLKDTSKATDFFLANYFEKGSIALQDYFRIKTPNIGGIKGFARNMKHMRKFYAGIKNNTIKTKQLRSELLNINSKLKEIYTPAFFPRTTFLIGGWSSGGTLTDYGSMVGVDMYSFDETVDTTELDNWQKRNAQPFNKITKAYAHELIHSQQNNLAEDTTVLKYSILEGMADFIGELISGNTANDHLHRWAKGNEKRIWKAFEVDMYYDRYYNWISNSSKEKADWPADLGYWVGYQICKAYYDKAANKIQAIYDMLHIKDYKAFLQQSGYAESFE